MFVELVNEFGKNGVDPRQFNKPAGVVSSHGSGLTDEDPAAPRWDYAAYHARRDGPRGFTNYNPYEFQAVYSQPVPLLPDEGAKPEDYGGDAQFAYSIGPLRQKQKTARFDFSYAGVDMAAFTDFQELRGQRFAGDASFRARSSNASWSN